VAVIGPVDRPDEVAEELQRRVDDARKRALVHEQRAI
jgi:hypothetical protein